MTVEEGFGPHLAAGGVRQLHVTLWDSRLEPVRAKLLCIVTGWHFAAALQLGEAPLPTETVPIELLMMI